MAALIASGLSKRYGEIRALELVDVALQEGEIRGLLGPNGAGKTTLLRILLGLVHPDAGEVELFGEAGAVGARGEAAVAGFVEDPSFYPYLSGRANLEVLAELDGAGARARIDGVLAQVDLIDRAGDRVAGYSSGMRQRLGIAAAMMRAPKLLLLDEPTTGLDPGGARDVLRLLQALAQDGVAVLLSSHQIGALDGLCDTFTVLSRGHEVWAGTTAEMRAQAPACTYRVTTSDDRRALGLAREQRVVRVEPSGDGALELTADEQALDAFVLALGREGIAVRSLELAIDPLEAMFFALTAGPPVGHGAS